MAGCGVLPQTKNLKRCFWLYVTNIARNPTRNKTQNIIKEKLPNTLVKNTKDPEEPIKIVKSYEEMLTTQNKRIMNIIWKKWQLLKRFRESEEFFDTVALSYSTIYFKMSLYKFLSKHPVVKNITVSCNYFKNNFRILMKVCRENVDLFGEKD